MLLPDRPLARLRILVLLTLAVAVPATGQVDLPRAFLPEPGFPGHGVCYGPHRDGQRPGGPDPSAADIREDLHLMAAHWRLLRLYGSGGPAETVLSVIRADSLDLKVVLGVWIAPDAAAANAAEVDAAIRLAGAYPDVVAAVSVGNETQVEWSAHRSPPDLLLAHLRRVRAGVVQPVTVADDFNFWNKPAAGAVAAEVDFILMHAHPLWNGLQLEDALPWLQAQLAAVEALHPGRPVVLGEAGWATGRADGGEQARLIKGEVGEAQQAQFVKDSRAWAEADGRPVFLFEAFDENWKGGGDPAEVEKHWGVYRADRTPKAAVGDGLLAR